MTQSQRAHQVAGCAAVRGRSGTAQGACGQRMHTDALARAKQTAQHASPAPLRVPPARQRVGFFLVLAPTQVARAAPHPTERRFALPEGATTSGLTLGAEQALRPPAESVLKTSQNKRHAPGLCAYYVVFLAPMTSRAVPRVVERRVTSVRDVCHHPNCLKPLVGGFADSHRHTPPPIRCFAPRF